MKENQDAEDHAECGLGLRIWKRVPIPKPGAEPHVERMLVRAERRSRQASKLVEKWQTRLADLDREGVATKQAKLFADDQPGQGSDGDS